MTDRHAPRCAWRLALTAALLGTLSCSSPTTGGATAATDTASGGGFDIHLPDTTVPGSDTTKDDTPKDDTPKDDTVKDDASKDDTGPVDISSDDAQDGIATADSDALDIGPQCGSAGCACTTGADCDNGYCIEVGGKNECAALCVTGCKAGFQCTQTTSSTGDIVSLCTPQFGRLCEPCQADTDCSSVLGGQDNRCVPYTAKDGSLIGHFCAAPCGTGDSCPSGYACQTSQSVGGSTSKQCVKADLACDCDARAQKLGLATSCSSANAAGTCKGTRACGPSGLSACNAPSAQTETCNTLDDNCNGLTDEGGSTACSDGQQCTYDNCISGECQHPPKTGACDDGSACTSSDYCSDGLCKGTLLACDDNKPCTADSCDPAAGCVNLATAGTCSDGDACTTGDNCQGGACTPGPAVVCDDSNPCTTDSCDAKQGCSVIPNALPCDDGNACSTGDACKAGSCAGPGTLVCDDSNPCTTDLCDAKQGCTAIPNSLPCDDGDACTVGDACAGGKCSAGSLGPCSDGNPCTTDGCDPKGGCVSTPNALACDDGNACTSGDVCKAGSCSWTNPVGCDDGNACTTDSCDVAKGCVHSGANGPCSDGNGCTSGDTCTAGSCTAGGATACSDNNPCTADSCEPAKGCVYINTTAPCDDGSGCTIGDVCAGGACQPGPGCGKNAVCGPKAGGGSACTCAAGYSGDGQICTAVCSSGCQTCASPSECTQCAPTKLLVSGACLDACPSGTYPSSGVCLVCPQSCATCSSATACTSCPQGQTLQNGQCSSCVPKTCGVACGKVPDGCGNTQDCGPCNSAKIEAGNSFSCALLYNGTVQCWGLNAVGQLGDGTYIDRWQATTTEGTPATVVGLSGVKQLALGDAHACALLSDGTVQCWGSHSNGQLGDNTAASTTGRNVPVKVLGISTAVWVTAGRLHSCAVLADGTAKCWGYNASGQLGDATVTQRVAPVAVQNLTAAITIGAGFNFTCALQTSGSVQCWGDNLWAQLGDNTLTSHITPSPVANLTNAASLSVAALGQYACVLMPDSTAQCWGLNGNGQLGTGSPSPTKVPTAIGGLTNIKRLEGGYVHTCAALGDGTLKCWGFNLYGQLGDGTTTNHLAPWPVPNVVGAVDVAAGQDHSCALLADATVQCWGRNHVGQLGNETTIQSTIPVTAVNVPCGGSGTSNSCSGCTPTTCQAQKATSGTIADGCGGTLLCGVEQPKLAAGNSFTCALVGNGTVECWGQNAIGQLGDGSQRVRYQPTTVNGAPALVGGITNAVAVTAGDVHACALLSTGKIRCWGSHSNGQLGSGSVADTAPHFDPVEVTGISSAIAVSAGRLHTCAALADGTVKCWGYNASGQLGDGTTSQRIIPLQVGGLSGVIDVRGGYNFTCALTQGGLVKCWGDAYNGQLGSGTVASLVPRNVAGLVGVKALATSTGWQHACAVLADGTAKCWGYNFNGQLGDGTTTSRTLPVGVMSVKGATSVAAGYGHSCALLSDGSLKCWGYNGYGQLGDTTTANHSLAAAVSNLAGVAQVATGQYHTCALLKDGTAQCWGQNTVGQVGNETSITATAPAPVSNFPCGGGGTSNVCGCTPTTCQAQGATSGTIADGCGGTLLCGATPATLAGGNAFGCAIAADATVKCWGYNNKGQLGGNGTLNSPVPVAVTGVAGAVQVSAGDQHACAVLKDGALWCWGAHASGQLGLGTATDTVAHPPAPVPGISSAVRVSAGRVHTCALLADGTARCWGANASGQLGDASALTRTAPVTVTDLGGLIDIAAGYASTCALKQNGLVKCWGENASGQLGNGTVSVTTPMNTATVVQATSLASGSNSQHACAVLANGTLRCWGYNGYGQLGDNSTTSRSLAISPSGVSGVVSVSSGSMHTCAVSTGGTAKCWGYNSSGQLGDTTVTQHLLPAAVSALTGATAVAAEVTASCFAVAGGGVKCTGANLYGGLGDGTLVEKHAVVSVLGL